MILIIIAMMLIIHIACWLEGAYRDWLFFGDKIDKTTWSILFVPLAPIAFLIAVTIFTESNPRKWNKHEDKSFGNFMKVGF